MKRPHTARLALALAALLLAPMVAQADRITAAYPELATSVANDSDSGGASARPAKPAPRASRFAADVDFQKMAIITEDAIGRGYKIVWVHPPQKSKRASNDGDR